MTKRPGNRPQLSPEYARWQKLAGSHLLRISACGGRVTAAPDSLPSTTAPAAVRTRVSV
jgi:hypothetical protein